MDIRRVHRLKRTDTLEALSAHYRVPVCMILRANGLTGAKDFGRCRVLIIPHADYCMQSAKHSRGLSAQR